MSANTDRRLAILTIVAGATIACVVLALLVALWRRGVPQLAVIAALTIPGSLGVVLLIGLGRSRLSYETLYATDRYFFPLLIPVCLLGGAVAGSISFATWSRFPRGLLLAFLTIAAIGELALQRRGMLAMIPTSVYAKHDARFASLTRLVTLLDRAGPIEIPRQTLWFPDLHNGKLRSEILTEVFCRNGRCRGVRLGTETNERRDCSSNATAPRSMGA
ncbi:MAG TPA: hypothetical protein VMU84_00825 [Thermoanaerobaculia bacterium]|nr:hypothetical protein [Thermoanaerobaculia bacterium]